MCNLQKLENFQKLEILFNKNEYLVENRNLDEKSESFGHKLKFYKKNHKFFFNVKYAENAVKI